MTAALKRCLARLRRDEGGAVTVDWVVLTAAMVTFGAVIAYGISAAATDPAEGIGAALGDYDIN